jgi:hypothetical protein
VTFTGRAAGTIDVALVTFTAAGLPARSAWASSPSGDATLTRIS